MLFAYSFKPDINYAKRLSTEWGIPVYFSHLTRHTDALALGRIICALDHKGKYFRLPELLSKLEERSEEIKPEALSEEVLFPESVEIKEQGMPKIFQAKLPSELLITSQTSTFFKFNKEKNNRLIYKDENLQQLRQRYTVYDEIDYIDEILKKKRSTYLIRKGIKYSNIIEIQYYINLIKSKLNEEGKSDLWNYKVRKTFIIKAKQEFKKQKAQYGSIFEEYNKREGLYKFAENYYNELLNNKVILDEPAPASPSSSIRS